MIDAPAVISRNNGFFIDTGSPHHVENRTPGSDFVRTARLIRDVYGPEGANVNFIQACEGELSIRTYERGVENETLACGTGATAAAMVAVAQGWVPSAPVRLYAQGGILTVDFKGTGPFTDVVLTGPAAQVFKGWLPL
jgi:diaminopimelate epimerase